MQNAHWRRFQKLLSTILILVSITGCGSQAKSNSNENISTLSEVKSLVRTLYYERQQAWNIGTKEGLEFDATHNYPGAFDSDKSKKCAVSQGWISSGLKDSTSVDVDTLALDENWTGPISNEFDWLFSGKKPKGQTYIVTITSNSSSNSTALSEATKSDARHYLAGEGLFL